MATDGGGSISRCIADLKAGDGDAARLLWGRYFDDLVRLARSKIRATGRPGPDEDEEDAALSAFDSLCAGLARGQFPELADREDLWKLLVVITARKAWAQVERRSRQKRGGGAVVRSLGPGDDSAGGLDRIADDGPTPEFAAMVAEEYQKLLDALGDDELRRVAILRMEGHSVDEVAETLGCARRTVARRLDLIRKTWLDAAV